MLYYLNKEFLLEAESMKSDHFTRIRRIYAVVLSVLLILAGICFISACLQIYSAGGEQPYTPQTVAAAFSTIAIPVYITLGALAGSILLNLICPECATKRPAEKQYSVILQRQHQKADFARCNPELQQQIRKQQQMRCLYLWVGAALMAIGSVIFLCYALNGNNFHSSDINTSMVHAVLVLIAALAVPFGYAVFAAYATRKSILKEIELVKLVPQATGKPSDKPLIKENTGLRQALRWSLVCIAVILIIYGYFAGGTTDVLTKAVNICTECVGLG